MPPDLHSFPTRRSSDLLALVADDMPTAMDFYTRVMGFRLVHVRRVPYEQDRGQPPYENLRHRSEEHTSELQSLTKLVCRLLLDKKNYLVYVEFTITIDR